MELYILNGLFKYFFALSMAVVLFNGCEDELGSAELPYVEKIVVRGILQAGQRMDSIYIGRTLPYKPTYNVTAEGVITNAVATVTCNDTIYPLSYNETGFYFTNALVIAEGETYKLHVKWNGKIAESITTVPYSSTIDTVTAIQRDIILPDGNAGIEYAFTGDVHSRKNNAIYLTAVTTLDTSQAYDYMLDYGKAVFLNSNDSTVGTTFTGKARAVKLINRKYYILISAQSYDYPFYAYFLTFGSASDDNFSSPSPVVWNVTGDGIGMFIGASKIVTKTNRLQ